MGGIYDPFGRTRSPFGPFVVPSPEEVEQQYQPLETFGPTPTYVPPMLSSSSSSASSGLLRSGWETLSSPLRALTGVTGGLVPWLLRPLMPNAYERAAASLEREESERGGFESLRGAAALPGLGDVLAEAVPEETRETLAGRILTPPATLAANILGDPTSYVGVGALPKLAKVAGVGKLGRTLRAVEELGTAGATGRAAAEVLARPSTRGVTRLGLTLPFSPIPAVAYGPELVEGVIEGVRQTVDDVTAGRYAEAAGSGASTLLTAGLGALVAKGLIDEGHAAGVLRRELDEQLGRTQPITPPAAAASAPPMPTAPTAAPAAPAPVAGPVTPAAPVPPLAPPAGVGVGVPPAATAPPPPPVAGPAPASAPAVSPVPGYERIRVTRSDATARQIYDLLNAKAESGQHLTKKDLLDAGLVTAKQAKTYSLDAILDAYGATAERARLTNEPGYGYRVAPAGARAAAPQPGPAAGTVVEGGGAGAMAGAPVVAPPGPPTSAPAAPAPPPEGGSVPPTRLSRTEIDGHLADPAMRAKIDETLELIGQNAGKAVNDLTRVDVAGVVAGDENKPLRALLYRALEAKKKVAREEAKAGPEPSASIIEPRRDETIEPPREPNEAARRVLRSTGLVPKIETRAELEAAREELDQIRTFVASAPEEQRVAMAEEFADRDLELDDAITDAYRRGVNDMIVYPEGRAPKPEPPVKRPLEITGPRAPEYLHKTDPKLYSRPIEPDEDPRSLYTPEGTPEATRRRVDEFLGSSNIKPETFTARAQQLIGKDIADADGDELNYVLTLAQRNPEAFGAPATPSPFDPQLTAQATRTLTGSTEALARKTSARMAEKERVGFQFEYDPASPAGKAQELAQRLEARGFTLAEDNLQEIMTKWVRNLARDDQADFEAAIARIRAVQERRTATASEMAKAGKDPDEIATYLNDSLEKARKSRARAEASLRLRQRLRRLLLSDEPDAQRELTALLKSSLFNREKNYQKREGRAKPIDDLIAKTKLEDLSPDERARMVGAIDETLAKPIDEVPEAPARTAADVALGSEFPERPAGTSVDDWKKQLAGDRDKLVAYLQPLHDVRVGAKESQKGKGTNVTTAHISMLRRMAESLGVKVDKKRGSDQLIGSLAKTLRQIYEIGKQKPSAAITDMFGSLEEARARTTLTDELVRTRGDAWSRAVERGVAVGSGGARAVDFEGDAGPLVRKVAARSADLASALFRSAQELSDHLEFPSDFGGFTVSPQLHGLRMGDGKIYLNPLVARVEAERRLANVAPNLEGDARAWTLNRLTAENMVDVLLHEVAHHKVIGHADPDEFTAAYARAMREAGEMRGDAIDRLHDVIERTPLDDITGEFRALMGRRGGERGEGNLAGPAARPGAGGAAAVEGGPGRAPAGAAGGGVGGARPIRPIPGGGAGPAAGVRAGAAAAEGGAARGAGALPPAGGGRGAGPGAGGERGAGQFQVGQFVDVRVGDRWVPGKVRDVDKPANEVWVFLNDQKLETGRRLDTETVAVPAKDVRLTASASTPSASLTGKLDEALQERRNRVGLQRLSERFAQTYGRYAGADPAAVADLEKMITQLANAPEDLKNILRTAKPQGTLDVGLNLNKLPADAISDEQKQALAVALAARNATLSRAKPMRESDVRAAFQRILEHHTPEEFIDMAKVKGLRDPADFAFLETVASTFAKEVDEGRALIRAAQIEADNAKKRGNATAEKDAQDRLQAAMDKTAHALFRRDEAIFTLIPESTRVARALAFRRMMFHPLTPEETFRSRFQGVMRASGLKKEKADQFYKMFTDAVAQGPAADWSTFVNAFRKATEPKWFDKFIEFWKAGLLGIPTQIANIGTNATFLGYRNAEQAVTNVSSRFFSNMTGKEPTRFRGEIAARNFGGSLGLAEAWDALKVDLGDIARLRTVDPRARMSRGTFFDDPGLRQFYGAIGGKTGEFVRIPFKLLDAFDNFFKHIIRNQEWAAQAHRLAQNTELWSHSSEGVTHATSRILEELRRVASDPSSNQHLWKKPGYQDALKAGTDAATKDTFQEALVGNPVRNAVRSWQQTTQQLPGLQLLTPFTKTPYNIIAEGLKRTPAAAAWTIKKYMAGEITDEKFVEEMVKSAMGTAIMSMLFAHALSGDITGGGPTDPKEVELLKRTGWQPRSFKIGNNYYSYQRLAPFSIGIGFAADMAEAYARKDVETGSQLMEKTVASLTDNVFDQSFVSGIDATMKILTQPQKEGLTAIRQLQASLVPNVIGVVPVGHLARATDPYYRETEAFGMSPFTAQIPGLSRTLPPQLTPTGEKRERKGSPLERVLSPIMRSEVQEGPLSEAAAEIARVGPAISAPPLYFKVGSDKVYYTQEERQELARAQEKAMREVARVIRSSDYRSLPDNEVLATAGQKTKRDLIHTTIEKVRRPVADKIHQRALSRAKSELRT